MPSPPKPPLFTNTIVDVSRCLTFGEMRIKTVWFVFTVIGLLTLFSFTPKEKEIADEAVLEIVANHTKLPMFNYAFKMAAVDCKAYDPATGKGVYPPNVVFKSRSTDTATHGLKIFKLFVKYDYDYAYLAVQPQGQILVKSTWHSEQVNTPQKYGEALRLGKSTYLLPTTAAGYFIMYKDTAASYATDNGWVYATVSPDGKTVLQKGLVASCMGCHTASKADRMLGAR